MTPERSLGGVVLAGGYSTRFGETDKAVAELAGTPMIRRVVDRLATVSDDLVINCRTDQLEAIRAALAEDGSGAGAETETGAGADGDVDIDPAPTPTPTYATDPVPDRGPLAGIRVGLETVDREYAAVVACDMPFVDPALLDLLADRARGRDGAVVRLEDGWYQTTQAVYRADAMARACEATLASDDKRIVAALERIDVATVAESDLEDAGISERTFESIDTQAALEEAEARLERPESQ